MTPQHTSMAPKIGSKLPSCPHEPELWGSQIIWCPQDAVVRMSWWGPARCPLNSGLAAPPWTAPLSLHLCSNACPFPKDFVCPSTIQPLRPPACPQLLCPLSTPTLSSASWSLRAMSPHLPSLVPQVTAGLSSTSHWVLMGTEVAAMPVH